MAKNLVSEYAKKKVMVERLTAEMKEMESDIYSIMVENGELTIGKKTYTLNTAKYQLQMTESNSSEAVDWKAVALSIMNTDEKTAKEYATKKGLITSRKGSLRFKAIEL